MEYVPYLWKTYISICSGAGQNSTVCSHRDVYPGAPKNSQIKEVPCQK